MTDQTTAPTGTGETTAATETAPATTETTSTILSAGDTGAGDAAKAAGVEQGKADAGISDAAKGVWPPDWRARMAGDDKKALGQLERYGSPQDVYKKARELEAKLSSGEYERKLPKDATEEQVKAWRAERGIPESPDGYKIELPNGVVLGESDKPLIESFTKSAHAKNWSNQQVNEALAWYTEQQDQAAAAQAEQDREFQNQSRAVLVEELGADYKRTVTSVNNMLATWPKDVAESVLTARGPDGRLLGDNPAFIKQLASVARELNPAATLLPAGGSDGIKGIADRIADIEKMMGDRSSDYWRGPKSDAIQAEYRDLIDAREKMNARGQAA